MRVFEPVTIARQFLYVRELSGNRGQRVEAIQKWCGGTAGDSWCQYFVSMVLDICYQGRSLIPRTGSCDVALQVAREEGMVVETPAVNDLVFSVRAPNDAHHVGIVTAVAPLTAIAGNTSKDGSSSNGDGVYEHPISSTNKVFVRVPQ